MFETSVLTLKCAGEDKHPLGEPKVGSALLECPIKKGAIWVQVTDDRARGVPKIPVTVAKAPQSGPKDSDTLGFASFDPLDPGADYEVAIELPGEMHDEFFPPPTRTVKGISVRNGEITSVRFTLERVAPLKVSVECPEGFPGRLDIDVDPGNPIFSPPMQPTEGVGFLTFPRLRKHDYQVGLRLSQEQKKRFAIDGQATRPWSLDPHGSNEVKYRVVALQLLRLEVVGAHDLTGDHHWCLADGVKKVRVKAITVPDNAAAWSQLRWTGGTPTDNNNEALVDITHTGDLVVSAALDVEKSVTVEVYDIVSVASTLPNTLGPAKWKAHVSDQLTRLKVTTKPDEERVWKHLVWSEGTVQLGRNEADVALKPVGDRSISVSLDGKALAAELHLCQWPRLEISKVQFTCHKVLNDGTKQIGVAFDKAWVKNRLQPAPKQPAASSQSPVCLTRNTKLKLIAEFEVTTPPTEQETVTIRGRHASFGELRADITVKPGGTWAVSAEIESSTALPNEVQHVANWQIDWDHLLEDGSTWASAQASINPLYLTLADPQADVYYTLLDIACVAAHGKSTEDDLVSCSFAPFKTQTGDGKGFPRKGDGLLMSYYKKGVETEATDNTYTTRGILGGPDATGRCGGWASLLLHMWKIHGVTLAGKRWYIRSVDRRSLDSKKRFLVKNIDFSVPGTQGGRYPHAGAGAMKLAGAPGQGKTNPQFDFGDHVVVKHGGKLYDPSYGLGPYDDDKSYFAAALDGLASSSAGMQRFTMTDGTKQFISKDCVPYAGGFAEYKIATNFATIAAEFKVTEVQLLAFDPVLKALRPTPDQVQPGDTLKLTFKSGKTETRVITYSVSLAKIASAHGVSEQAIFDDPANATLKLLRTTPAGVQFGDTIIVTPASAPGSDWVIGHDL